MNINKNFLQSVAALWILVYHLWINISGSAAEQFLVTIAYAGVDIFFLVSSYSIAGRDIKYGEFFKTRFLNIYLRFVFFAIIAAIYAGWSIIRTFKTVLFIDFFEKGGGSFLWFLPSILLLYLLYPLFLKWKWKYKTIAVIAFWLLLSLLLEYAFGYTEVFIFTNRIPVIIAGYLLKTRFSNAVSHTKNIFINIMILLAGLALLYFFGFRVRINYPFHEFFLVLALPVCVSLCCLSGYIKDRGFFFITAKASLELYALQMIFGADLVTALYKYTKSAAITDILMIIIMLTAAVLLSLAYRILQKKFKILCKMSVSS